MSATKRRIKPANAKDTNKILKDKSSLHLNLTPEVDAIIKRANALYGKGDVKCLDKTHEKGCKLCTSAPSEEALRKFDFVGDDETKNGEIKLKLQLLDSSEWQDDDKREAVMSAYPEDAEFCKVLMDKSGKDLKKVQLVRLCKFWKLNSNIWQLKSSVKSVKRKISEESDTIPQPVTKSARRSSKHTFKGLSAGNAAQVDMLTMQILKFLQQKKDFSITKFQSVIAQDPANLLGLNGYEDEQMEKVAKYAKTNMPFVCEFLSSMMNTCELAKERIFTMLMELRETNSQVLAQPATVGLQVIKQTTDFNSVNSIMTMFGYCCTAFRSALRPKRPQHIELYIAEASNGCVELTEFAIAKMEEIKNGSTLEVYFHISLAVLNFLQGFFHDLRELAKMNYFIKFGHALDAEQAQVHEEYKEQIWDFFW